MDRDYRAVTEKPTKAQLRILQCLLDGARLDTWLTTARMWTANEAVKVKFSTVMALRRRYWIRRITTRAKCRDKTGRWMLTRRGRKTIETHS